MKHKEVLKKTSSSKEYKMTKKRTDLRCAICPPHKGENAGRRAKHGPKKPKYKEKRGR